MAATVSAWAKPGAWALDSEEHEEELLQQPGSEERENGHRETEPLVDFPSLAAAAATKPSKKKKPQTVSLAEFTIGTTRSAQSGPAKGLTPDELLALPTGPRQRSAEELDRSRLGGGFRSYGSSGYDSGRSRYSNGDESSNSRWGPSRASDEPRRHGGFSRESSRELAPSRADEIDDWGAAKKSTMGGGFERRERGGFFDSQSKADESDNWASNKSFVPSEGRRFGSSGGGFDRDRRGGFDSFSREGSNGSGVDSDTWAKKKEEGSGSVSGRRRLNLQPRTLPVSNGQPPVPGTVAKPKGSNPFGEARPREQVLAEKGQDWKKIDEQLESMKIKETGSPSEGPAFGKRSFGSGNGRASLPEDRSGRSWRKTEDVDVRPSSAEKSENEVVEEN